MHRFRTNLISHHFPPIQRCMHTDICILYAVLKERVPARLAYNEVCPLCQHDADEEDSVAGVFQLLTLVITLQ